MLLVVDIVDDVEINRYLEPLHCDSPFSRAARLCDLEIEVLICGAVSSIFANMIENQRIKIIPFVAGTVGEVLDAYLRGRVCDSRFHMPGCRPELKKGLREESQ